MFGFLVLVLVGAVATILIRRGASLTTTAIMVTALFVPLSIAFAAWFLASPPIWTFFAPRLDATIQIADVPETSQMTMGIDSHPIHPIDIRVRLDRERSGRLLPFVGGEIPSRIGQFDRITYQDALRSLYPIGSAITVRYAGDVTYVDKQDWFSTAAFLFCVVFALLALMIVMILAFARSGSRAKPPS